MLIENSVMRVTVRHHEACLVMPNSNPEWWNFQFEPNNHYGFFFLHTLPSQLHLCLKMLFYQKYTQITTFYDQEVFGSYLRSWRQNILRKMTSTWHQDVQNDVKIVILTSCTRVVLHPSCKTTFPSPGRVHGNSDRVCKNISFSSIHCKYIQFGDRWKSKNMVEFLSSILSKNKKFTYFCLKYQVSCNHTFLMVCKTFDCKVQSRPNALIALTESYRNKIIFNKSAMKSFLW